MLNTFTFEAHYTPMKEPSPPLLFRWVLRSGGAVGLGEAGTVVPGQRASTRPEQPPAHRLGHRASGRGQQPHTLLFLMPWTTRPPDESTQSLPRAHHGCWGPGSYHQEGEWIYKKPTKAPGSRDDRKQKENHHQTIAKEVFRSNFQNKRVWIYNKVMTYKDF